MAKIARKNDSIVSSLVCYCSSTWESASYNNSTFFAHQFKRFCSLYEDNKEGTLQNICVHAPYPSTWCATEACVGGEGEEEEEKEEARVFFLSSSVLLLLPSEKEPGVHNSHDIYIYYARARNTCVPQHSRDTRVPPSRIWPAWYRISHIVTKTAITCETGVGSLVGRSVGRSVDYSVGRSIGRSIIRLVGRSADHSVGRSVDHSVGRSIIRSVSRLVGRSVGRSVSSLLYIRKSFLCSPFRCEHRHPTQQKQRKNFPAMIVK